MELTLDRFGRIVLPKALRKDFGLHPGSRLQVSERKQEIVLRPEKESKTCILKNGTLVFTGVPNGNIAEELSRFRNDRIAQAGGL